MREPHPETTFGGFIAAIRPLLIDPTFVLYVLRSKDIQQELRGTSSQTTNIANISLAGIRPIAFPLPPLAEQRRIVGKVDQLLGLCDELAARQAARREARSALVGATLDRLVSARSAAEFPAHAHRLRDHFDRLFDTPTTIPQLRQAILQLAVQGQLVPQDPNDEPAVELSMEQLVGRENMKNGLSLTQTTSPSQFGCVPISSMRDGVVDCSFTKPISISDAEARQFLIRRGDVFLMRGNGSKDRVGRAGLVVDEPQNVIFPDLFIRLILDQSRLLPAYFLVAWNSPAMRNRIERIAKTTSGIYKINQGHVASLSIPIPPLSEQMRIVSKVTELLSLCDALETKLTQAESASTQLLSASIFQLLNNS